MRMVVIGLGVQGRKRRALAGKEFIAAVDPVHPEAEFKTIQEVPVETFDAAFVCVPDREKLPILRYLLAEGKHWLVEKPLLARPEELRELRETGQAKKLARYTAYNHRFEPHLARLKTLLDEGRFGTVYLARMFYGNGTARDIRASPWRDQGLGVIVDLGSHLLDLALFFFGPLAAPAKTWTVNRFENRAPDQVAFGLEGRPLIECEGTFLSWRNTFSLDLYGEKGSGHIHSLCKWGPSTLTLRTRVLPSGRPEEVVEVLKQPDPTWELEYAHFRQLCATGGSNLDNDLWLAAKINDLAATAETAGLDTVTPSRV